MNRATLPLSLYDQRLGEVAALFGADDGAIITRHEAEWTEPCRGMKVVLFLDGAQEPGAMIPRLRVSASGTLPTAPLEALMVLRSQEETLHKGIRALHHLGALRVVLDPKTSTPE